MKVEVVPGSGGAPVEVWRSEGAPAGAPRVVLAHGAGSQGGAWAPLLQAWERHGGAEVVAPTLPGRGGTAGAPLESIAAMAGWLRATVRALGLAPALFVGHSLGGAIALEAALMEADEPGVVSGLGLIATGARLRVHPAILQGVRDADARGEAAPLVDHAWAPGTGAEERARTAEVMAAVPTRVALVDWLASDAFDRMADLGRIAVPAVVLVGDEDFLTPEKYARFMVERLPRARLVQVPGTGHQLPSERPEAVVEALEPLLRGEPG